MTNGLKASASIGLFFVTLGLMAQITGTDWLTQIRNKPFLDQRFYNFAAQSPSGTLVASTPATIALRPVPYGVNGSDTNHQLYLSTCSGGVQLVTITGGSAVGGTNSGTISFTPTNSCNAGWKIQSATGGLQELHNDAAAAGATADLPAGAFVSYGTVTVTKPMKWRGAGFHATVMQLNGATQKGFNVLTTEAQTFQDFTITTVGGSPAWQGGSQQTSGGSGVSLGANGIENGSSHFQNMSFRNLWNCLDGVNATAEYVAGSEFISCTNDGVVFQDTTSPDNGGQLIVNSSFTVVGGKTIGEAGIKVLATGGISVTNSDLNNYQWGVLIVGNSSSGIAVANNDIEGTTVGGVFFNGAYSRSLVTGNTFANFAATTGWAAVANANGTGGYNRNISSNVMLCSPAKSNLGVSLVNSGIFTVSQNQFVNCDGGGVSGDSTSYPVVIGNDFSQNGGVPITGIGTFSLVMANVFSPDANGLTFARLGSWANGSIAFCQNCNSTCTAGASNGQNCQRANGAWSH